MYILIEIDEIDFERLSYFSNSGNERENIYISIYRFTRNTRLFIFKINFKLYESIERIIIKYNFT